MPFIGTQVNFSLSGDQKENLKRKWDKAISLLPGKSAQWLMADLKTRYPCIFKGTELSRRLCRGKDIRRGGRGGQRPVDSRHHRGAAGGMRYRA